jgi:hypothetical protein
MTVRRSRDSALDPELDRIFGDTGWMPREDGTAAESGP